MESIIQPPEAGPKTGDTQRQFQCSKVIVRGTVESQDKICGGEEDDEEMDNEDLTKLVKKMMVIVKSNQKRIGKENKQEKSRQKTMGKGKGRGGGRAKSK
jgi:hypothetical protein